MRILFLLAIAAIFSFSHAPNSYAQVWFPSLYFYCLSEEELRELRIEAINRIFNETTREIEEIVSNTNFSDRCEPAPGNDDDLGNNQLP